MLKINRMNNDNEPNDANDNGKEFCAGLPQTERQELLRQRREVQQEIPLLRQERDWLLLERQGQVQSTVVSMGTPSKQSESILFIPDRFCRETSHEMRMLGANQQVVALTLLCSSSGSQQVPSWRPGDLGEPEMVPPTQGGGWVF